MMKMKLNKYLILVLIISINTITISMNAQKIKDEVDSVSYSLGVNIGENIKSQFPDIDMKNFESGIRDVIIEKKQPKIEGADAQKVIQDYFTKQQAKAGELKIKEGENFLAENAKRKEVKTLESGLQYEIITVAEGPTPTLNDKVTTHYHGTLLDGTVFDSSVDRGQPATFPVSGVIKGWTEALQLMSVGAKWRLYVPYNLAYGEKGVSAQIGPYTTLIFDVELLKIN